MTPTDYKKLLAAELADLRARLKRRQTLKKELDFTNKQIAKQREGVLGLGALAEVNVRTTYPEIFTADVQANIGLTDAIRKLFDEWDSSEGYSPTQIREGLVDLGFPIHQHQNPLASITSVLKRLVDAKQLVPATDQDTNKTIYFWADGYGAGLLKQMDDEVEEDR